REEPQVRGGGVEGLVGDGATQTGGRGGQHQDGYPRVKARRPQPPSNAGQRAQGDRASAQAGKPVPPKTAPAPDLPGVARVSLNRFLVPGFFDVVIDVPELDRPEAHERGAVWIALRVRERMVLTVNGDPFFGREAGREPEGEAEHPFDRRMEGERTMRRR